MFERCPDPLGRLGSLLCDMESNQGHEYIILAGWDFYLRELVVLSKVLFTILRNNAPRRLDFYRADSAAAAGWKCYAGAAPQCESIVKSVLIVQFVLNDILILVPVDPDFVANQIVIPIGQPIVVGLPIVG